jgi:hypothetical protein
MVLYVIVETFLVTLRLLEKGPLQQDYEPHDQHLKPYGVWNPMLGISLAPKWFLNMKLEGGVSQRTIAMEGQSQK